FGNGKRGSFDRRQSDRRSAGAPGALRAVHGAAADLASSTARRRQLVLRRHGAAAFAATGILVRDLRLFVIISAWPPQKKRSSSYFEDYPETVHLKIFNIISTFSKKCGTDWKQPPKAKFHRTTQKSG